MLAAGALIAVPTSVPPHQVDIRAVDLRASPLDPYVDLITNTVDNLGTLGAQWLQDPLPTAVQLATNWFDYAERTVDAFGATARSFVDGVTNLPGQIDTFLEAVSANNVAAILGQGIIIVLSVFPVAGLVDHLMSIPIEAVGNAVNASIATLHALQVPVGLAALSSAQAALSETEMLAKDFIDDLTSGDLGGALTKLIGGPAQILDAYLNSDSPGLAGLLTHYADQQQTGLVDALLNALPRAVAESIGAPHSPIEGSQPANVEFSDLGGEQSGLLPDH